MKFMIYMLSILAILTSFNVSASLQSELDSLPKITDETSLTEQNNIFNSRRAIKDKYKKQEMIQNKQPITEKERLAPSTKREPVKIVLDLGWIEGKGKQTKGQEIVSLLKKKPLLFREQVRWIFGEITGQEDTRGIGRSKGSIEIAKIFYSKLQNTNGEKRKEIEEMLIYVHNNI